MFFICICCVNFWYWWDIFIFYVSFFFFFSYFGIYLFFLVIFFLFSYFLFPCYLYPCFFLLSIPYFNAIVLYSFVSYLTASYFLLLCFPFPIIYFLFPIFYFCASCVCISCVLLLFPISYSCCFLIQCLLVKAIRKSRWALVTRGICSLISQNLSASLGRRLKPSRKSFCGFIVRKFSKHVKRVTDESMWINYVDGSEIERMNNLQHNFTNYLNMSD